MVTIKVPDFEKFAREKKAELFRLINYDLPVIAGKLAVDHFKMNFDTESWQRKKWQEVQRRMPTWERNDKPVKNPHVGKAAFTRKILTGETGDLGRSIEYNAETGEVTISSDLVYAEVHNYGLKAGRGSGFKMPQRKFMGDDPELNKKISAAAHARILKIMKQ